MSNKIFRNPCHHPEMPTLTTEPTVSQELAITSPFTSVFRQVGESPILARPNHVDVFANYSTWDSMRDWALEQSISDQLKNTTDYLPQFRPYDCCLEEITNEISNLSKVDLLTQAPSLQSELSLQNEPSLQTEKSEEIHTGKVSPPETEILSEQSQKNQGIQRKKIKKSKKTTEETSNDSKRPAERTLTREESKNIVKNYGKAMSAFMLSDAAAPYLEQSLNTYQLDKSSFKGFVMNSKETISGISTLQVLLNADAFAKGTDDYKLRAVFREMCEVFLKYFAINWIFECKSNSKDALLICRYRMLRRVQSPSKFTHLL